jgi:hypothetical protein
VPHLLDAPRKKKRTTSSTSTYVFWQVRAILRNVIHFVLLFKNSNRVLTGLPKPAMNMAGLYFMGNLKLYLRFPLPRPPLIGPGSGLWPCFSVQASLVDARNDAQPSVTKSKELCWLRQFQSSSPESSAAYLPRSSNSATKSRPRAATGRRPPPEAGTRAGRRSWRR